jgi:hypothetical protein
MFLSFICLLKSLPQNKSHSLIDRMTLKKTKPNLTKYEKNPFRVTSINHKNSLFKKYN